MPETENANSTEEKSPLKEAIKELTQPFVDLVHAPRALWGINLGYVIEGMVYFGVLSYLALHFSDFVFEGVDEPNSWAHVMVGFLTAGITISMFFLGFIADRVGVRRALLAAFALMLVGRVFISGAPNILGLEPNGLWSGLHLVTMGGILLVVIGYGMYMPAAYAAVRQFTTPKTAAMGFAMLYALMNLGGWLPTFAFFLRDDDYLGIGIPGTFWVYTFFTAVALVVTFFILSRRTVEETIATAKKETAKLKEAGSEAGEEMPSGQDRATEGTGTPAAPGRTRVPLHIWGTLVGAIALLYWRVPEPANFITCAVIAAIPPLIMVLPRRWREWVLSFIANHPLADIRFFFFISALIPVQTLFTYNWLVLPQYISRAFSGWIGEYFEIAANANPLLIFVLVPVIAAATRKAPVYRMMILGTTVMAAPAFLLALGPKPWTLFAYILIMTVGEAMWQPRFLQYAAEIAPEGRTGEYIGVANLPWFLTKMLVPLLYSGWMMDRFCPADGPKDTEIMWLIYGAIAIISPILLLLAKNWMGQKLEEKAA